MSEKERRIANKKRLPGWGWAGIGIVLIGLILGGFALQGQKGSGKIAFTSDRDGDFEIYIMDPDGSGIQQLTDNDRWDMHPAWSPDGSKIAFFSDRDGDNEIYVMNPDGSGIQKLTDNDWSDYSPAWSP